jgi:hypothetical protein
VSGTASETGDSVDHNGSEDGALEGERAPRASRRWTRALRMETVLAVEIMALTALIFSRPALEILGRNPHVFTERQVTPVGVAVWGITVAVVPALVVAALGAASRLAGGRARQRVHVALVAVLAGLATWRLGVDYTELPSASWLLLLTAVMAAAALGVLRSWSRSSEPVGTFLRYAGIAPLVFLGQFAVASPAGDWAFRQDRTVDREAARSIAADLGDDPPPVVVVVLDELPTATLLDGDGQINADLFPNLADLASTSTWYRNHTTVATRTYEALPAMLSATYTARDDNPRARPANLFTMLAKTHEFHVHEPVTDLCPPRYCPHDWRGTPGNVGALLDRARFAWTESAADRPVLFPPELTRDRFERAEAWIRDLDLEEGDQPPFVFYHVLLPHSPWELTDDGTSYRRVPTYGVELVAWREWGVEIGQRRHVLQAQATDQLVGLLFDRLDAEDMLDDALVVVTADHGVAFLEGEPHRVAATENLHQVLWTPLLVKAPGQSEGEVVDDNVELVDVLPTIAKRLGLDEFPWEVHGVPASEATARRDPAVKTLVVTDDDVLEGEVGEPVVEVDANEEFERLLSDDPMVPGAGSDAVWERTRHRDLLRVSVEQLTIGDPLGTSLEMREPESWEPLDTSEPLPLVLVGNTDLPDGSVVAFALNGGIAALGEVEVSNEASVQALALPDLFVDGDNEITAYVVEGQPGRVTLHPIDVRF